MALIFVGYSGSDGMSIALSVTGCLRKHKLKALLASPKFSRSATYLESEEQILRKARECDAAIMICTKKAYYSQKFQDEVNTLVYDAKIPVIALVQKGSPVMSVLKLRYRIKFVQGRHRRTCKEIIRVLRLKMRYGSAYLVPEGRELPVVRTA